jgi:Glycosyl transferase family group 2
MIAFLFLVCTIASAIPVLYYEFIAAVVRRHRRSVRTCQHLAATTAGATSDLCDRKKDADKTNWLVIICVLKEVGLLYRCVLNALIASEGLGTVIVALDSRTPEIIRECHRLVEKVNADYRSTSCSNTPAQALCIPTFLGWKPGVHRKSKAVALNIILSLRGTTIFWYSKSTLPSLTLRRPAIFTEDWQVISIPSATFIVCVDVDEILMREGLQSLMAATRRHPEAVLVQCAKYDQPVRRNPFSRGFTAAYTSWFLQGAAWSGTDNRHLSASYYGSMAALKIDYNTYSPRTYTLTNGEKIHGIEFFPTQYAVEDYPLYVRHLRDKTTVFLPGIAGQGLAPVDAGAFLRLWGRWAFGNLATIRDLPQIALGRGTDANQKRCMQAHAISWMVIGLAGTLPILSSFSFLIHSVFTIPVCLATASTTLATTYRLLLPVRDVSLADRALRVPTESILWPVSVVCLANVIAGNGSLFTSPATPRYRGRIPIYYWLIYLSELALMVYILAGASYSCANLWVVSLYILGNLPLLVGVVFLMGDTLMTVCS